MACALLFLAAALLDWFSTRDSSGKLKAAGLWLVRLGWVLLTALLSYQGLRRHSFPITTPAELFLTLAWGVTGLSVFLDLTFNHRLPSWAIGATAALGLAWAGLLGIDPHPLNTADKPLIWIHVGAAVLAYCVLAALALNSAAYLLQDRALAKRRFGGIYALLPALVPLDRIGSQLMGAAVWILGISLVIGATDWAERDLASVALPKLGASLLTWLGCLFVIIQRRRHRLLGASFARAALIVFIPALIVLYLSLRSAR